LFGGGGTVFAAADNNRSEWRFAKPIELQGSGKYRAVFLDEAVYKAAQEDLDDLRIVDDRGQFVPFYRDGGYAEAKENQVMYKSDLIDTVRKNNDTLLDYRIIPLDTAKDIQGNALSLSLPAQPFLKHLEIYGGHDGNQWELLKKDYIYRTERLEKSTITLDSDYKFGYYRIKVLDNVDNLRFPQLQLINNTRETKRTEYTKIGSLPYEIKQDKGQTIIAIKNENRLHIAAVRLEAGGSFSRLYTVQDADGKETRVEGKPELYRMDFQNVQLQNTTIIAAAPFAKPQLNIKINNLDSPPLALTGVTIDYLLDKLVFEHQEGRGYQLLYGNEGASKPAYDIAGFRQLIEKEQPQLSALGAQVVSPNYGAAASSSSWWFQTKTWFNAVIVAVSVLLVIVVGMKLSRAKDQ
jgi:hypothetical protein